MNQEIQNKFNKCGYVNIGEFINQEELNQFEEDFKNFTPDMYLDISSKETQTELYQLPLKQEMFKHFNLDRHTNKAVKICHKLMENHLAKKLEFMFKVVQIHNKPAQKGGQTRLHQEHTFFRHIPYVCTFWLTFDGVNHSNCMYMIEGSHQYGYVDHQELRKYHNSFLVDPVRKFISRYLPYNGIRKSPVLGNKVPTFRPCIVERGHAHIHHQYTVHGSPSHKLGHDRRSLIIHCMFRPIA